MIASMVFLFALYGVEDDFRMYWKINRYTYPIQI